MKIQPINAAEFILLRTGHALVQGHGPYRLAAGCHRPDGDCHHDDVGHDGVHRGCEADDDDRHQPDHEAAARPLIPVEHDLLLW